MDIKEFFERQNWTFAKTYAEKAPHEYIIRSKIAGNDSEFIEAVQYIRDNGIKASFWKKEHIYLYLDGMFYWTMGAPIDETIVINRCSPDDYELVFYTKKKEAGGKDVDDV